MAAEILINRGILWPAMALSGLNAAVLLLLVRRHWQPDGTKLMRFHRVVASLMLVLGCWLGFKLQRLYVQMAEGRDLTGKWTRNPGKRIRRQNGDLYIWVPSRAAALWFGNTYSGRRIGQIVSQKNFFQIIPTPTLWKWCPKGLLGIRLPAQRGNRNAITAR